MAGEHRAPASWLGRWHDAEPLRLYLHGITLPLLGLALTYGWLTERQLGAWSTVAGALFIGSTVAGELARRVVWSPQSVTATAEHTAELAYQRGWEDATSPGAVQAVTEQLPVQQPATVAIPSLGRCRRVEDGRRCTLASHPEAVAHVF